jgi:hypothetical protein
MPLNPEKAAAAAAGGGFDHSQVHILIEDNNKNKPPGEDDDLDNNSSNPDQPGSTIRDEETFSPTELPKGKPYKNNLSIVEGQLDKSGLEEPSKELEIPSISGLDLKRHMSYPVPGSAAANSGSASAAKGGKKPAASDWQKVPVFIDISKVDD